MGVVSRVKARRERRRTSMRAAIERRRNPPPPPGFMTGGRAAGRTALMAEAQEAARQRLREHYDDGMLDGTLLALDLIVGQNSGLLDPDRFEELRYSKDERALPPGLLGWVQERRAELANQKAARRRQEQQVG